MRIIAFDTATEATTVALTDPGAELELELRDDPEPGQRPGHATRLLPLLAEVLERAGGGWEAVDRIAVGIGPGSFTGLRIGVATARALARARTTGLVGVSSLEALAAGAREARTVLAVIDARRGEVFAAAWRDGKLALEPAARAPEELARTAATLLCASTEPPLAVGDGALRFRAELESAGVEIPPPDSGLHRISAIHHCRLAGELPAAPPGEVGPAYLRAPDAEIAHRKRGPGPP